MCFCLIISKDFFMSQLSSAKIKVYRQGQNRTSLFYFGREIYFVDLFWFLPIISVTEDRKASSQGHSIISYYTKTPRSHLRR